MWIMAGFGILMPAIRPPKTVPFGDLQTMQIRARRAKDLDILRAQYMPGRLGPTLHTAEKDYEYRAYCTPEAFALAMARMVERVDYTKFKPTVKDIYHDTELYDAYNSIWLVVMRALSTARHRQEYWRGHGTTTALGPKQRGVSLARRAEDTVASGAGAYYDSFAGTDYDLPARTHTHRGAAADRDEYTNEVWDEVGTGFPHIDALYAEVDDLEKAVARGEVEHTYCKHGHGFGARRACRRGRLDAWGARLAECRREIDDFYHSAAAADIPTEPDVAESSGLVTVIDGDSTTR